MFRFILACMCVVALTIFATTAQFMISGIEGKRLEIAARNAAQAVPEQTAAVPAATPVTNETAAMQPQPDDQMAEDLNRIESAAGGTDDGFPAQSFTNTAPAGLEDAPSPAATPSANDGFGNDSAN